MKLSVIIPCYREEKIIKHSVQNALEIVGDIEIIVVAQDQKTYTKAKEIPGIMVLKGGDGRGDNCRIGGLQARGDFLLFKHADSMITSNVFEEIKKSYEKGIKGGTCTLVFDKKGFAYSILELSTRPSWSPTIYGDASYWFEKKAYDHLGGFKTMSLFEDADIRRRWKRKHRFVRLRNVFSETSARRFTKIGPYKQILLNSLLFTMYYIGVPEKKLTRIYRVCT